MSDSGGLQNKRKKINKRKIMITAFISGLVTGFAVWGAFVFFSVAPIVIAGISVNAFAPIAMGLIAFGYALND